MNFNDSETAACRQLVQIALEEDLGTTGDLTSQAVVPANLTGGASFTCKAQGVVAGIPVLALVAEAVDKGLRVEPILEDGAAVKAGTHIASFLGPTRAILAAERTALNFLQHLSGIATETRRYVTQLTGLHSRVLDTRKTIPGWRLLEKYAVRCGGGHNHRMGLHDGILIKDNHLEAGWFTGPKPIRQAVDAARKFAGKRVPLEIEVEDLQEFDQALDSHPDIVLLDNMTVVDLREAVRRRNERAPDVLLEASGGITLATVRSIAETGVDRISVGALTHSAPALDIALDYSEP